MNPRMTTFWTSFGPGLVWAASAIGVSHLVQSTRAGAVAGLGLVGLIGLALVVKYPFFEYGPRYAAATGTSLVEGYGRIGRWALWLFLLITVVTAVISQAAVVMFTAYLGGFAFQLPWSMPVTAAAIMGGCALVLVAGRYRGLDTTVKVILAALAVSTIIAAVATAPRVDFLTLVPHSSLGSVVPLAFVLALIGWMPSPVDTAVWSSLWTLAKDATTGHTSSVTHARMDFSIAYVSTAVLAVAFVTLGAGVMYGTGVEFSPQGTVFATQLADLYGQTLGAWARPVVLVAIVTTMLSTSLTVVDGFPRALERTWSALGNTPPQVRVGRVYWGSMIGLAATSLLILLVFLGSLTAFVDFATIVSFLTAPILGFLNLRCVTSATMPEEHRPGRGMIALTWIGLVLLGGTGLVYLGSLLR